MTEPFFREELNLLKNLASEFASANPALAPLLDQNKNDPDVERLLEAVAFQNAMLRRKLYGDFPQLVRTLVQLVLPHYLRPLPATTMMAFTPHPTLRRSVTIPAGTQFASAPVDGAPCRFTTSTAVEVHPLELCEASFSQRPGRRGEIRLELALMGLSLAEWHPHNLHLFLTGDHTTTDTFLLLGRHLHRIVLSALDGGSDLELPANCLTPAGFDDREGVLPYPPHAFPGYRLLQEYFHIPQKFLAFNLKGWERWQQRGDGTRFTITFELSDVVTKPPRIRKENFLLHTVPAVNLFQQDAEPVTVNHRNSHYRIRPCGLNPGQFRIFSVDRVTGYTRANRQEREYAAFELFSDDTTVPLYHAQPVLSHLHGGFDVNLCLSFPGTPPSSDTESVSITLTCTNGTVPEKVRMGDIREPLYPLPDFVSARNVTPINPGQDPPTGSSLLRRLTSHLYLNHLPLEQADHLRALLELYIFSDGNGGAHGAANMKRVVGIESMVVTGGEVLDRGVALRGRKIRISVRQDHFAGPGDLYLFGCVLEQFLGRYAALNCYTQLEIVETLTGVSWQWPARLGNVPLS